MSNQKHAIRKGIMILFTLMNFYFLGGSIINDTGRQKNTGVSKAINQDI